MNKPKIGDLVLIIDPDPPEPIKMGVGLVVGETKFHNNSNSIFISTPVLWNGEVQYLADREWMLEVI